MSNVENKMSKQFIIVWLGQLVSNMGSGISAFALGVYVFKLTHSASYYSWVLLAAFMPSLLLKPIGGMLADYLNRRAMMIIGDTGSALSVLFIIVMLFLYPNMLWPIYVGTVFGSIAIAIQNPAYKATITDLLKEGAYSKGSGLVQLAESSRYIISPMVAGLLISHMAIEYVLAIDCLSFIVAVLAVFKIRKKILDKKSSTEEEASGSLISNFFIGFKFIIKRTELFILLLAISIVTFFVGLLQALWGPMMLSFTTAKVFGFSQTTATFGMLVSSLLLGMFSKSTNKVRILSIALMLSGIFFAAMGVKQSVLVITISGFLFFLVLPFINTSLDVLVRRNIDNSIQGRVWAAVSLISQLGMGIAFVIAGYISSKVFYPILLHSNWLAKYLGSTPDRGIALTLIVSGICITLLGVFVASYKKLITLDSLKA